MIRSLLGPALEMLGVEGVSTAALLLLVSVALYAHKAGSAAGVVIGVGGTITHDLKIVAVVLAGLLLLGVVSVDTARAQEVIQLGQSWLARQELPIFLDGAI